MEKETEKDMEKYLRPTYNIDSDHESIIATAKRLTEGCSDNREKAVKLFYFVRDSIHYNVFMISAFKDAFALFLQSESRVAPGCLTSSLSSWSISA